MLAIGNDELDALPDGSDRYPCPECGEMHEREYGTSGGVLSRALGFIKCPVSGKAYLVEFCGKGL